VLEAIASQSSASHFQADVQFGNVANAVPFKHRYDLQRHFVRHGEEFGAGSADEYERQADIFMIGPLRDGALECTRDGDLVRFDPRTDEFGVLTRDGHIATFMILRPLPSDRQTALEYFKSNCK
jgi:filamentous hemagglutinin